MVAEGNMAGNELIEYARYAFVEGMVASAYVSAAIAFMTAILVKIYMPARRIEAASDDLG